ncbi:hypothetical protein NZ698_16365 [Chryseobacterium sp. PBS4-4]|uniref:DUF4348 domain-containing protein n=1 Tax=Chryseobacterium edaphi TaxID=2976532 RepID=A0ABT2WDS7_9FLAO|nr:hypothetical protein [Chryseobacterium edaphi]MCU7618770.1 hypothetical protein [Chryseobacterium edaphi]
MKNKHFFLLFFIIFYVTISCKENKEVDQIKLSEIDTTKSNIEKSIFKKSDSININFLDKKYQADGIYIADNAPSYPSYNYSDDKIGAFNVDYIGKTTEIQNFWDVYNKKGYFSKFKTPEEASHLSEEIKKSINFKDYYVLASYIPSKYISYSGNADGEFDLKPNALTYFYLYVDNNWKLIHKINTNTIPIDNILKFETSIIQKELFKNNKVSTKKYNGLYKFNVQTSIPSAEIAISRYEFTIDNNNSNLSLITYLEPPICDGKYFAIEKNNLLELYYFGDELSCISIDPKFYIKKEGSQFYLKIAKSREKINKWIMMK